MTCMITHDLVVIETRKKNKKDKAGPKRLRDHINTIKQQTEAAQKVAEKAEADEINQNAEMKNENGE